MVRNTISEDYLKLQQELHLNPHYGIASLEFAPLIAQLAKQANIQSISDYGAGKKRLLEGLVNNGFHPKQYYPFDPAFPGYGEPKCADLVCCIDVRSGSAKLNRPDKCIIGVFRYGKGAGAGGHHEQIIWAANPPRV